MKRYLKKPLVIIGAIPLLSGMGMMIAYAVADIGPCTTVEDLTCLAWGLMFCIGAFLFVLGLALVAVGVILSVVRLKRDGIEISRTEPDKGL